MAAGSIVPVVSISTILMGNLEALWFEIYQKIAAALKIYYVRSA
jgi:hypothetical protein